MVQIRFHANASLQIRLAPTATTGKPEPKKQKATSTPNIVTSGLLTWNLPNYHPNQNCDLRPFDPETFPTQYCDLRPFDPEIQ